MIACFVVIQNISQAQKNVFYKKEFSFFTENDAYMFRLKDGYYTAGHFLQYSIAKERNSHKIINRFELGQTMFTTGNRRAVLRREETIDRPYCGYLYAKYVHEKHVSPEALFSWNVSIGATGKWSLAQQLQEAYHKLLNLYFYPYWETQIPNAIGVNAGLSYKRTLAASSYAKIVGMAEANAGMFYTNAKVGGYFCLGAFENNNNSALFNTRINNKATVSKREYELFFYFYPQLIAQGYNATTQGTLFYKTGAPTITSKPSTIMYQQIFGLVYARPKWTARIETNYQTKETALQNRQQRYAGVQFAYRFN